MKEMEIQNIQFELLQNWILGNCLIKFSALNSIDPDASNFPEYLVI